MKRKPLSRTQWTLIAAIAAGVMVLAAVSSLAVMSKRGGVLPERYAVVYAKGSQNLCVALPEGVFPLRAQQSKRQWFGGEALYYDAVTDEGLDLYALALRDSDARQAGGTLLAQGIGEDWFVSAGGDYAVYVERAGGRLFCRGAQQQGEAQPLADSVEALYAAPGQDVFFFEKREGGQSVLSRCQVGARPERMTGAVEDVRFFSDARQAQVFYTTRDGDGARSLYTLGQSGGAALVAEAPGTVLFERYELGGNLYFLKEGLPLEGAAVTVADPDAQADALLTAPKKPAAPTPRRRPGLIGGWLEDIFGDDPFGLGNGGGGVDSAANAAYEKELAAYQKKQLRDKVRAAANEALDDLPAGLAQTDCYVYDGVSTRHMAEGVAEGGVIAARGFGRPVLLYMKERAPESAELEIPLDTLLVQYNKGGAAAVRDYIHSFAQVSPEAGEATLAMRNDAGVSELPMEIGAEEEVQFLYGSETMLLFERDVAGAQFALYACDLTDYGLSARRLIDTDVTETAAGPSGLYYRKQEGTRGALYYYGGGEKSAKLLGRAGAFFFTPDRGALLAFSDCDGQAGTLNICEGAAVTPLAQDAKIDSVRTGGGVACLANWSGGTGEVWLSQKNKPAKRIDGGATEIMAVK